jgi:integrase
MAAIRRLPSGKWSAEVRLPNGRRTTKTDTSKTFVRQWAADLETQIRRGEWQDPETALQLGPILTVGQWREMWIASRHREINTAAREDNDWKMRVGPAWADHKLDAITRLDIQTWSATMSTNSVSPHSHAQAITHLRQLLSAAVTHGKLAADPSAGVKKPIIPRHVDRILTRKEWARLDDATGHDPMIRLMLWCGLRWQEAAGIYGEVVDLGRGRLWIVRVRLKNGEIKERPKSESSHRPIPVPSDALSSLRGVHRPAGELFTAPLGGKLTYDNWRRRFVKWVRAAQLPDPQPTGHDLRHSYATWLADAGVPVHDIGSLLGHADTRSTNRYVHSGLVRDAAALEALDGKKIEAKP